MLITDPAAPAPRRYREAIGRAREIRLRDALPIRLVTAPYFLATKYEAFLGRGRGDYLASHDFEDMIAVIDGRPELEDEVRAAAPRLREYLAAVMRKTLADERFLASLGGFVSKMAVARIGPRGCAHAWSGSPALPADEVLRSGARA